MPNEIVFENLSKRYGEKTLFEKLSGVLAPGGRYLLAGKSGCGKTTLLRILAGLTPADGGSVRGIDPAKELAMVFQEPRLFPTLTVRENLLAVIKKPSAADLEWAEDLLGALGLSEAAELLPAALSGGMAQRVAIARALLIDRPVLFLDEPFKGLDAATKAAALSLLSAQSEGKTLLLVTHDLSEAEALRCTPLPVFPS